MDTTSNAKHLAFDLKFEVVEEKTLEAKLVLKQGIKLQTITLHSKSLGLSLSDGKREFEEILELPNQVKPMSGRLVKLDRLFTIAAQLSDRPSNWRLVLVDQSEAFLERVV